MRLKKFGLKEARKLLPVRKKTDNKSSSGRSLIIAGSEGMYGAAVLASEAASRIGSGFVYLYSSKSAFLTEKHPSFLVIDSAHNKIPFSKASAFAIGPGLGKSKNAEKYLKQLIKAAPEFVVIDADALNICAKINLWPLPSTWIATPHEGELARIIGVSDRVVKSDRIGSLKKAKAKMGCICLIKGHHTLVAADSLIEIRSGNAALAKAGTGDVLTGMITGLLAQGLAPKEAACLGVFIHGWLADQWIKDGNDELSLMPEDLVKSLPKSLKLLRG